MIPLLRKELRALMRERRSWLIPAIYVSVLGAVIFLYSLAIDNRHGLHDLGQMLAGVVAVLQTAAVILVAPLVGGAAIAGERERGTLALLLASTAPRGAIGLSKAVAATLYVLFVLSASVPVVALALFFGGPDLATLAGLLFTHAVQAAALVCIGLGFSALFQRTWLAVLAAIGLALSLLVMTLAAYAAVVARHARSEDLASPLGLAILSLNPGFGTFLFLNGEERAFGHHPWLCFFAAQIALGGLGLGLALSRLRRMDG
jgi:ABC-2 type transport system permease protein